MSSTTITLAESPSLKGLALGSSKWFEVTQDRVSTFADATDDHQWIRVDPKRATAESPFGGPIGHGFLTLSLFVPMWGQIPNETVIANPAEPREHHQRVPDARQGRARLQVPAPGRLRPQVAADLARPSQTAASL